MRFGKLLALAAAFPVLAGCGNALTDEQIADYGEIGYADIISFITIGYQIHWDEMDPADLNLSPVYSYCSPYTGFTRADIDSDGFDELLIGDQFEDGSYALYDIYRFNRKDASLIHLASGGERDRFVINEDGVIIETGSNSAEESFTKGYRIRNDRLVEVDEWKKGLLPVQLERFFDLAAPQQLCGGYSRQREPSDEEMKMFRSVVRTGTVTYTPLSVSTQVVAGTNYRFYCRFGHIGNGEKSNDDNPGYCWITIFKPLPGKGEPSLTSIE